MKRTVLSSAFLVISSACGVAAPPIDPVPTDPTIEPPVDADAGTSTPLAPTWWQDVEPIVRAQCHLCHGPAPLYGAPMSLVTYEDALRVHPRVAARIQRSSALPPMPPVANGHLTDEQIELIATWSKNGAPEGTRPAQEEPRPDAGAETPDSGEQIPDPPENSNEEPYLYFPVVAPQVAIRPETENLYGCFRTIIETDVPLHVVEIEPNLDQLAVVHHILLFRDSGRNYPEERTGLLCAADTVIQPDWELLHGWAPGGAKMIVPPEAGMRIEDGEQLIVQLHYYNASANTVVDGSGMMLKATAALRPNDAATLGVGPQSFTLPAGQPSVSVSGDCAITQPMKIFGYSPHMHLLGRAAKLERIRNGQTTMLADVQTFAFESQILYPADIDLVPGDVLRSTCTYDTTSRTTATSFGEGTEDEMCYVFVGHYPPFGEFSCGSSN